MRRKQHFTCSVQFCLSKNKTKQNEAKQNKTIQNKTKTKQNKKKIDVRRT